MRERHSLEFLDDVAELHGIGLQKIPAGGNIVKKIFNGEGSSFGTGAGLLAFYLAAFNDDLGAQLFPSQSCFEFHLRDGCNGSEGFTAKPFGADIEKVICLFDLGGGM